VLIGDYVYFGGLDNTIKALNLKKNAIDFALFGHLDTVTGLSISPDGKFLASNSMDNTVKIWDIRPYVPNEDARCLHTLYGAQHNFEKNLLRAAWSHDGTLISAGSADRFVCVWDVTQGREGKLVQRLGGHHGSVNEVAFNPRHRNVIASGSSDKSIYLGEL
jgi:Prp8 binding protein